jgi:hypothetical protein
MDYEEYIERALADMGGTEKALLAKGFPESTGC